MQIKVKTNTNSSNIHKKNTARWNTTHTLQIFASQRHKQHTHTHARTHTHTRLFEEGHGMVWRLMRDGAVQGKEYPLKTNHWQRTHTRTHKHTHTHQFEQGILRCFQKWILFVTKQESFRSIENLVRLCLGESGRQLQVRICLLGLKKTHTHTHTHTHTYTHTHGSRSDSGNTHPMPKLSWGTHLTEWIRCTHTLRHGLAHMDLGMDLGNTHSLIWERHAQQAGLPCWC